MGRDKKTQDKLNSIYVNVVGSYTILLDEIQKLHSGQINSNLQTEIELPKELIENKRSTSDKLDFIDKSIIEFHNILLDEVQKLYSRQINSNLQTEIEQSKDILIQEILEGVKTSIRKGLKTTNINIESNTNVARELKKSVSETKEFMENTLNSQLQDATVQFQQLMEKRQEIKTLEKEIESWQDGAVEFFQFIEITLENISKLDTQNNSISKDSVSSQKVTYEKVLKDFERRVNPLGLQRICPKSSDDVDQDRHKVDAEKESEEVQPGQIIECKKWGYTINGKLYSNLRAEVIVAKAPDLSKNANQSGESEAENSESSNSIKNDSQDLAQNSETLEDNNALESASVDETNEPKDTLSTQPEIKDTDESNSPSDSESNKSEEDEKNNTQSSQAEHPPTSE